jgi:hypothetical protein
MAETSSLVVVTHTRQTKRSTLTVELLDERLSRQESSHALRGCAVGNTTPVTGIVHPREARRLRGAAFDRRLVPGASFHRQTALTLFSQN